MANLIETATIFQTELDKAVIATATSGWMELNENLVKYSGGRDVKIPKLNIDGLADYDRSKGFVPGSINLSYETKEMTQDRGRSFTFDENEVSETNFVITASSVMGEFQRTQVIPEIDAYRYSAIAAGAITKGRCSGGYTPAEETILNALYADIAEVQDKIGASTPLVITMSTMAAAMLDMSTALSKSISTTDFAQGDVTLKVKSLNGVHPIISVGANLLKTAYVFNDGETSGQTIGGFTAAASAKDINWIISAKKAPIAVSKTDKMRIFEPEIYQKGRMWALDYRKFHDLWIPDNKWSSIYVNIKQALA